MKEYRFISHTADLKIRVYGKNFNELIKNILLALVDYWQPSLVDRKMEIKIKIKNDDQVNLLIDFIAEVINKTYVKKAVFVKFRKEKLTDNLIEGRLTGYKFSALTKDIKAVTYHQANLRTLNNVLIFDFIVDI